MLDDLTISLNGLDEALRSLDSIASGNEAVMKRTLYRVSSLIKDRAVEFANVSPTLQVLRKVTGRAFAIRKERGTSRPKPGGLERSIEAESSASEATIYVAANSEAGAYAFRIHEEKGISWHKRGPGTIAKGAQADSKFITRAIVDRTEQAFAIIDDAQRKALGL